MDDLDALIARLEKATEYDRDDDYAIAFALGWKYDGFGSWDDPQGKLDLPPAYTASIDAAMQLVPEGWSWKLIWEPAEGFYRVVIRHADTLEEVALAYVTHGKTAAIALTIAALKARKQNNG